MVPLLSTMVEKAYESFEFTECWAPDSRCFIAQLPRSLRGAKEGSEQTLSGSMEWLWGLRYLVFPHWQVSFLPASGLNTGALVVTVLHTVCE